jgi:hypothetical protein
MATGSMASKEARRIFRTTALAMLAIIVIVLFFRNLYDEREVTLKQTTGASVSGTISFTIVSPPTACAPINLTAVLNADNVSVDLSWTEPTSCIFNNYTLYYNTNVSAMENLDFSSATQNVTLSNTTTNWTDWDANSTQQRYYRVAVNASGLVNGANETAGKFDWQFIANSPKTIALPLQPVNKSVNRLIRPAQGYDADNPDTIMMLFGDNDYKVARWYGSSIGWANESWGNWNDLQLEPNVGYYLYPINNSYNATIVGLVPAKTNVTFSFIANSPNTMGIYQPYFYNLTTTLHPAQGYDPDNPDTIMMLFGDNDYKVARWYGSSIGWANESWGNWNDLMLEPGVGYYLYPINNSYSDTINMSSGVIP